MGALLTGGHRVVLLRRGLEEASLLSGSSGVVIGEGESHHLFGSSVRISVVLIYPGPWATFSTRGLLDQRTRLWRHLLGFMRDFALCTAPEVKIELARDQICTWGIGLP
jgi:hypothetical protein